MKKKLRKFVYFWFPPILWMALIFWASSFHTLRASPVNWQDFIIRKSAHLFEYLVLYVLLFRALKKTTKSSWSKTIVWSFFLSVLYGVTDEFHQSLVNGRSGMIKDVFIDAIGAMSGWLLVTRLDKKRRKDYITDK